MNMRSARLSFTFLGRMGALVRLSVMTFAAIAAMSPNPAAGRESFAEQHGWGARHVSELPRQIAANVFRQQRACGAPVAATHFFALVKVTESHQFVSLHYENLWCPNRAVCAVDGCLHEVYVNSSQGYRLVFRGYALDARISSAEQRVNLYIKRADDSESEFRWNGRRFLAAH